MIDISIYTPVYNGGEFIKRCIDSVLSQEFSGTWEWIIVDDGSTDDTVELIKSYNDDRIKVIECEHKGIVDASNTALDNCQGKYCARIDADDEMMPNRLQVQFDFMEQNPQYGITCGKAKMVLKKHEIETRIVGELTHNVILKRYPITHSTVMLRNDLNLRYDKEWEYAEDNELWMRYTQDGQTIFLIDSLFCTWYKNPQSITTAKSEEARKKLHRLKWHYRAKKSNIHFNLFKKQ